MKWFWRIFLTLALIAAWGVLGYLFVDYTLGSPKRTEPVEVKIEPNTSLAQIGKILEEKHLIRRSYFFRYYAAYKHKTKLQAGIYEIEPNETLDDMLNKFAEGKQNTVRVTIPEGWNVLQIADALQKEGFDKRQFLYLLNHKKPKYAFELKIPTNPNRPYKLEGYLFPTTYEFYKRETPEQIINQMLGEFAKHMEQLQANEKLQSYPPLPGMTVDQWVTVASLIQREGEVPDEYPQIASVIYNRLKSKNNKKLQVDASVVFVYAMKGQKVTRVTDKMLAIKSPYNTYQVVGLPPGPIACPSLAALNAALNPAKTNYQYYVARGDGSKRHFFAVTLAEHNKNVAIYRKNMGKKQVQVSWK